MPTQYVIVNDPNRDKPVWLPTDPDNKLPLLTLEQRFPGAHGLEHETNGAFIALGVDPDGTRFLAPDDDKGWEDKVFTVIFRQPRSFQGSGADANISNISERPSDLNETNSSRNLTGVTVHSIKSTKYKNLKKWIYFCDNGGEKRNNKVLVSVISEEFCASACHCFPNAELYQKFEIYTSDAESDEPTLEVEVIYTEPTGADLIVFTRVDRGKFESAPQFSQLPYLGTRYIAFGLDEYRENVPDPICVIHGVISSNLEDNRMHIKGDTGNAAGFSGGLVLSRKWHALLGLITSRSCADVPAKKGKQLTSKDVEEITDRPQPQSYILSSTYLAIKTAVLRETEKERLAVEKQEEEKRNRRGSGS